MTDRANLGARFRSRLRRRAQERSDTGRVPSEDLLASRLKTLPLDDVELADRDLQVDVALSRIADRLAAAAGGDAEALLWLLHIAFVSELPTAARLRRLDAELRIAGPSAVIGLLQDMAASRPVDWATSAPIEFVTTPVVEVSRSASTDLHTGIQRVVREVTPRWVDRFGAQLVALDPRARVLRRLTSAESTRVLNWGTAGSAGTPESAGEPTAIIVPWRTQVVLPEYSTDREFGTLLAALADRSGNEVCALFYDATPYAFPDLVPERTLNIYGRHVAVLRHATRVSAISRTAATDLVGLRQAWEGAGLTGPQCAAQPLPLQQLPGPDQVGHEGDLGEQAAIFGASDAPLVLSVSSITPHKNQLTILLAAEELWAEGHRFQLVFIAGSGWRRENFDSALAELQQRGRLVHVISEASEELLRSAYRLARFTVFVSFAEGFGLPAAESIAAGTPVVLSGHGSMREIGEGGGAHFVDPHVQAQVTAGMRLLLTDDEYLKELASQARKRHLPTWDDYAADTWNWLVEGNPVDTDG